jgi:hypothetical protein
LLTKTIYDEEDNNKIVRKTLRGVTHLVFIWMDQGDIEGVISDNDKLINP